MYHTIVLYYTIVRKASNIEIINNIYTECLAEVATLGANSAAFAQNAQARLYKKIIVDGNIVMFIASSAGMLTHAVLDKGNYCNIEKSVAGAYWSGYIFRLALGAMNMAFS